MNQNLRERVLQAQMDALCARTIHRTRLTKLRRFVTGIDVLVIIVPILFFAPRLLANTPGIKSVVGVAGVVLGAVLLALGVTKQILRWQDKVVTHARHLSENIMVKNEADRLLQRTDAEDSDAISFLRIAESVERPDADVLADVKLKERQAAYRESIKELQHVEARCAQCGANPWEFEKGLCQMCGGKSPASKSQQGGKPDSGS